MALTSAAALASPFLAPGLSLASLAPGEDVPASSPSAVAAAASTNRRVEASLGSFFSRAVTHSGNGMAVCRAAVRLSELQALWQKWERQVCRAACSWAGVEELLSVCSTLSGRCIVIADRGIVVAGQACKKAFEELHLQYSNVFRVLHSCQKQDMTSQQCTAAANSDVSTPVK